MADTPDGSSSESLVDIQAMLRLAGIEPTGADLASLGRIFPGVRRKVDRMYEIDTGDEVTASVFRAEPDS
ncbi:MAG: hypothetical protein CL434_12660 [Acidimicrobiaceae bacterium]|jgi:hypothetical protein|nr:hypothetical protein [Acidimicrobiaceae bacterium]